MPAITVRGVSEAAYAALAARAERSKRSLSQEAAWLLERALRDEVEGGWAVVDRVRERMAARYGAFGDSTEDIAEDRRR